MFGLRALTAAAVMMIAASAAPASAADPIMNWSGFYLGGTIGARQTNSNLSIGAINEVSAGNFIQQDFPLCTQFLNPCAAGASLNNTALRIGSYAGYNWQAGERWIAGIEGDWAWADGSTTQDGFKFFVGNLKQDSSFSVQTGWDASVRARIGYLVTPAFLVYGTGGAAWLKSETTSNCGTTSCFPGTFAPSVMTQSTVWSGWTLGGGAETMLGSNWILRAEYRYAEFGTRSFTDHRPCSPTPTTTCGNVTSLDVSYDLSMRTHTAMIGLAYKFGGPGVVRP